MRSPTSLSPVSHRLLRIPMRGYEDLQQSTVQALQAGYESP